MHRPTFTPPLTVVVVVVAFLAGAVLSWVRLTPPPAPQSVEGLLWPSPRTLEAFELVDHRGSAFTAASLQGKWTLLFFGFTHCPDICPNTLNLLKRAAPGLGDAQVVFVSVDPARDTTDKLAAYVAYFNPSFIGVTGEPKAVERFTQSLGVLAVRAEPAADGSYNVDHTASVLVVDPRGRLVGTISQPFTAESLQKVYAGIRTFVEQQS
jgi:protein SCO1/2